MFLIEVDMANRRRVSPEQEKEVTKMFNEGYAISLIARTLGVPIPTMRTTAQRLGLKTSRGGGGRRRKEITPQHIQEMVESYSKGTGTKELSHRYGVTDVTVARYLRQRGVELRPAGFQREEKHHAWAGGRVVTGDGYVLSLVREEDPFYGMAHVKADGVRYALEHRLVMARQLGRPLRAGETVHHIDGDKTNNSSENLQLRQGKHGKGVVLCCSDCGSRNIVSVPIADNVN